MLPFLMLGLAAFIYRCGDKRWLQFLIGILGVWSFLAIWAETIGGQSFPDWRRNPLFTYSIPNLLREILPEPGNDPQPGWLGKPDPADSHPGGVERHTVLVSQEIPGLH